MVSEYKIVSQLHHSFNVVWITFLEEQQKLGFNCCLVVVLFLVFDEFDCNKLFVLVVHALDYLSESTLANHFDELVSKSDVVILLNSVVSFFIVESVIYQTF